MKFLTGWTPSLTTLESLKSETTPRGGIVVGASDIPHVPTSEQRRGDTWGLELREEEPKPLYVPRSFGLFF